MELTCTVEYMTTNDLSCEDDVKSAIDPSNSFVIIARHGLLVSILDRRLSLTSEAVSYVMGLSPSTQHTDDNSAFLRISIILNDITVAGPLSSRPLVSTAIMSLPTLPKEKMVENFIRSTGTGNVLVEFISAASDSERLTEVNIHRLSFSL